MKSMALIMSFLLSTNVFAEKFSVLVQCQFEGPIHEAVFVLPTKLSDWTCRDVNGGASEFVTSVAPTIEINGIVYTGATSYRASQNCEWYGGTVSLPDYLKFKSPAGFDISLGVEERPDRKDPQITYANNFAVQLGEDCTWVRK